MHDIGARDPPPGRRRMHMYKEKVRRRRPGGAAGGQTSMAGGVAPAAEAQSWPRLGSARLGSARLGSARLGSARLGSARLIMAESKYSLVVKPFFEKSITFSPSAPLQPVGNRARKAAGPIVLNVVPPPISEAPHETGVLGFVDASKDTDRRDSVRGIERARIRPVPAPLKPMRSATGP